MLTARRLPWALACVGAIEGWTLPIDFLGENATRYKEWAVGPAIGFGAALFVAGWVHAGRPRHEHQRLGAAAVRILLACLAFGLAPAAIVMPMSWRAISALQLAVVGLMGVLLTVLGTLPPALLLVHAAAPRSVPRAGSFLVGIDRAEDSLALLAAVLLLPWWRSNRPWDTACLLFLLALPALAIGLHAIALIRRVRLFEVVAGSAPVAGAEGAAFSWDLGVGGGYRAVGLAARPSYRTQRSGGAAVVHGDSPLAQRSARRVLAWSVAACAVAAAHGAVLLLRA
jgi:hypothetical protein